MDKGGTAKQLKLAVSHSLREGEAQSTTTHLANFPAATLSGLSFLKQLSKAGLFHFQAAFLHFHIDAAPTLVP